MDDVYVTGRGALSPGGACLADNWAHLSDGTPCLRSDGELPLGRLHDDAEASLATLASAKEWRAHDRAVLLGVLAARQATAEAKADPSRWAVVMGSSRGATGTLERSTVEFQASARTPATTSPVTTAGAFPAAVARDLGCGQLSLFVSAACATGLHAIGLGFRLLRAGQARGALVGATEAANTAFTLSLLQSARVYARRRLTPYPMLPMHPERNGMVLGEGAACLALELAPARPPLARVVGYGAATEHATLTGITEDGRVVVEAVRQALDDARLRPGDVDLVVGHGSSTRKGDLAERAALATLFGDAPPVFAYHKWLTGHMLGASGAYSAALAVEHLRTRIVPPHPYFRGDAGALVAGLESGHELERARHAVVVAMGFGGNAAALVLAAP